MKKAAYKLHLKKDDIVEVISGKEKGKKGKKDKRKEKRRSTPKMKREKERERIESHTANVVLGVF